jgi:hypothetical protein
LIGFPSADAIDHCAVSAAVTRNTEEPFCAMELAPVSDPVGGTPPVTLAVPAGPVPHATLARPLNVRGPVSSVRLPLDANVPVIPSSNTTARGSDACHESVTISLWQTLRGEVVSASVTGGQTGSDKAGRRRTPSTDTDSISRRSAIERRIRMKRGTPSRECRGWEKSDALVHYRRLFLIERSKQELLDLVEQAGVPRGAVSIRLDESHLAWLVEITRPGN